MQSDLCISELIAPAFYPVHLDILSHGHSEYWLRGGRGSAKSSFVSLEIVTGLLRNPDANAVVYRRVAATLRESVYEQMLWAIGQLGLQDFFRCRVSPMVIEYIPTGQRILFRGADDPAKSKSIKLAKGYFGFLWFEELAEFDGMDDVRTIKAGVVRGSGRSVTFLSYNPPRSASDWVNREAQAARPDRLVHASTYLDVPPHWLGGDFIAEAEALRVQNEKAWRHMYMGEVTGTGGSVFENIALREISRQEIEGFGQTYAGLDFGWFPDPLHFARCAYDPARKRLWIYDEYRAVKTSNRDAYDSLCSDHGLDPCEEVIADSADRKSIGDMRFYGMNCVGAEKGPGSVGASMRWLQALSEIVIDPARCPAAAREFTEYEYERTRADGFVGAYPDANNHAIDAVRYALNRVWMRAGT